MRGFKTIVFQKEEIAIIESIVGRASVSEKI